MHNRIAKIWQKEPNYCGGAGIAGRRRSATGVEPVREWLRALPAEDRRAIGGDLATLQVGWPIGMPLCRALGGGL